MPNIYSCLSFSRYLATVPTDSNQQRIEFHFMDRPDDTVADSDVNAIVILFAPGVQEAHTFSFHNLDLNSACNGGEGCEASPVLSCPAIYMTVEGEANNRFRALQSEPDCSDCANPACVGKGDCAIDTSLASLNTEEQIVSNSTANTENDGEASAPTTTEAGSTSAQGETTTTTTGESGSSTNGDSAAAPPSTTTSEASNTTPETSGAGSFLRAAFAGTFALFSLAFGF